MPKDEVDQKLETSWELPEMVGKLRHIVIEIEQTVIDAKTKEMLYELIEIVLECGERIHDLETKLVGYGTAVEENERWTERIRVDLQKDKRAGIEPKDDNYHHDPDDVPEWKF